jgi:hypothetical protein
VIKKIKQKLRGLSGKIETKEQVLAGLQAQWKEHHDAAQKSFDRFEQLTRRATSLRQESKKLRKAGHHAKADARAQAAVEHEALAAKAKAHSEAEAREAQHVIPDIKRLQRELHGLQDDAASLKKELAAAVRAAKGGKVKGNSVVGGTPKQRLQIAALASMHACASGDRHNFYSQTGLWDVDHCITGPAFGHRDDCSSWFTSVYKSCGLPDPNKQRYGSGFTGSLVAAGQQVSREYARNNPGCAVIYGSGPGHHVEFSLGDGTERTVGHGSSPVDMGVFDLFGSSEPPRFFKFALS